MTVSPSPEQLGDLVERLRRTYARGPCSGEIAVNPDGPEAADALQSAQAEIARLTTALEFYADPENYHAISFMVDPPCGGFADDFDEGHGHEDYDRAMPGKRARAAIKDSPNVG